jgi:hypothetical protein
VRQRGDKEGGREEKGDREAEGKKGGQIGRGCGWEKWKAAAEVGRMGRGEGR